MRPELRALDVADPSQRWEALGFTVTDGSCEIGGVRLWLGAAGSGITGWTLIGIPPETTSIDGLKTTVAAGFPPAGTREHANGAIALDHVVVTTPRFERTAAALEAAGMPLRRVLERPDRGPMGFRRLGPAILELVEATSASGSGRATGQTTTRFWGLVVVVEDLDALAEHLGSHLGSTRKAVQPGRQIATLRESAGLGEAVAFMTPETRS